MNSPLILSTHAADASKPVLILGTGLPREIDGQPVEYRRKTIARAGRYWHRGTREPFELTPARLDALSGAFAKRTAKGIRVPITPKHVDPTKDFNALETLGYLLGIERNGDDLEAVCQLIGPDAIKAAAANDVSICTVGDAIDADNEKYPEALHHLSLTPDSAISNLGPWVKIAASGAGATLDIPVYTDQPDRSTLMKPETLTKLRAKLKLGADVKDDDVAERAAELALTDPPPDKTAEVTALSVKVTTLESERDAAKADVLRLSGSAPREPDPMSLALITRAFKTDRERVIESGVLSEAGMVEIDNLLMPAGKPTPHALSLSAGSVDPHYSRLCEIIRKHPGIKTGNGVARGVPATLPPLSASINNGGAELTKEQQAEVDRSLAATETGRRAIAARKSA